MVGGAPRHHLIFRPTLTQARERGVPASPLVRGGSVPPSPLPGHAATGPTAMGHTGHAGLRSPAPLSETRRGEMLGEIMTTNCGTVHYAAPEVCCAMLRTRGPRLPPSILPSPCGRAVLVRAFLPRAGTAAARCAALRSAVHPHVGRPPAGAAD